MVDIPVMELFSPICVDPENGTKLCDLAHQALDRGEIVCLDFTGVSTLAGAFLNTAVGCLYAHFSEGDLARRLFWKGLDPTDEGVLRFIQRNAIRFYSANPAQQKAMLSSAARIVEV